MESTSAAPTPEQTTSIQQEMRTLNTRLTAAAEAYYNDEEIMSNREYDALYDRLVALESLPNITPLPNSITKQVGTPIPASSQLSKQRHSTKMLSLDKTKSLDELASWLGSNTGCLSWKLDGSTLVLTYENGALVSAVTRGNGEVGEVVTQAARFIDGIPQTIAFEGKLEVRGECYMEYEEFERVNSLVETKYKNPRNLANGTLRCIGEKAIEVLSSRKLSFQAFSLIEPLPMSWAESLDFLEELGFAVVEHEVVGLSSIKNKVVEWRGRISSNPFPSDGLVVFFDDAQYGRSLGSTSHAPRNGMAFKWADETATTIIRSIDWSLSRTGRLNPVACFDSVELEGTTVSRASLHNLDYMEEMGICVGDEVEVYKANMIIPQVAENLTKGQNGTPSSSYPSRCPRCGAETVVKSTGEARFLVCPNGKCSAKSLGSLERAVSRDGLDIRGISTETLNKLGEAGIIDNLSSLLAIAPLKDQVVGTSKGFGIGEKAWAGLLESIEKAKASVEPRRLLYSLSIEGVGRSVSRDVCKVCDNPLGWLELTKEQLLAIDGIGETIASSFVEWFGKEENREELVRLVELLGGEEAFSGGVATGVATGVSASGADGVGVEVDADPKAAAWRSVVGGGKKFVVTGSLDGWDNRDEFAKFAEALGGELARSVGKSTDVLVVGGSRVEGARVSSKVKKAESLGIAIVYEAEVF